ncbi:MAG TPA: hypothetical protein VGQ31_02745 [Candidatus Limnocylindrales bacterium]|jgi:hypothetical protein|nr:hypothetical protein [Candidatus Limnocylindrales bacterium]
MHPLLLYSQAVQRDRFHELESEEHRLLAELRATRDGETSRVRRSAALVFAALSRGSAAAVRRLDACVADDLGRALTSSE